MRNYLQHGRRHMRGGTDPIPGLSGKVEWAVAYGHLSVSAPGNQTYFDLSEFAAYGDNDTAGLYFLGLGTGPLSANHGLRINEDGVYRVWWHFIFAGTAGDTISGVYGGEAGFSSNWGFGNTQSQQTSEGTIPSGASIVVDFAELIFIGGSVDSTALPSGIFPSVIGVGTVSAFTADVTILIERLSDTYTGSPP